MNDSEARRWMTSMTEGAIGGMVATLPMTVTMLAVYRLLPWTQRYRLEPQIVTEETAKRLGLSKGVDKKQRQTIATLAHFGFGAGAGALFGPMAMRLPVPPVIGGMAYGLAVWAASYAGWLPAFGILRPPKRRPKGRNLMMIAAHLVWGAVLGLMVGRRVERRQEPSYVQWETRHEPVRTPEREGEAA